MPSPQPSSLSRPPGILIADDEEAICFSLSRELRRQGMAVYLAANGMAALKLYAARLREIDAVFLDVRMPLLDGPQTFAALRRLVPDVRCCFMTAYGKTAIRHENDAGGLPMLLEKPFDLDQFLRVVQQLLHGQETKPLCSQCKDDRSATNKILTDRSLLCVSPNELSR